MPDDLTRHINRKGPDQDLAERLRVDLIRSALAPRLAAEAGGVAGTADRPHLTLLVQEVWLRLENGGPWKNRAEFLGAASIAGRRVLIDEARKRARRIKTVPLEERSATAGNEQAGNHTLRINRLLHRLADEDETVARIAGYRLFGQLSHATIAEIESISERTSARHWAFARAWLIDQISLDN